MKNILHGVLAIAFAIALVLLLFLVKVDVADAIFAMLAGGIVGCLSALAAITFPSPPGRAPSVLLLVGVAGGSIGWLFAMLCVGVLQMQLYSTAALAFDLLTGLVGGTVGCLRSLGSARAAARLAATASPPA